MPFDSFKNLFVAMPDGKKGQLVYKWPDQTLKKFSQLIVDPDYVAVFTNQGQVVGTMPNGKHQLDASEWPFLGDIADWATDDKAFRAELYFVSTRQHADNKFGGRVDDVLDQRSGLAVGMRAFGEYTLQVTDPEKLIFGLTGSVDVADPRQVTGVTSDITMKVLRTVVTEGLTEGRWQVLGLSAHTRDIEQALTEEVNAELAEYGVQLARVEELVVSLDEADEQTLKTLQKDSAYTKLAGGYDAYTRGEALKGAGEGMSKGGGSMDGAFLAAGMGVGGNIAGQMQQPAQQPAQAPQQQPAQQPQDGGVECAGCGTQLAAEAKFCGQCGTPTGVACRQCDAQVAAGAKFCSECGTPTAMSCAECDAEVAAEAKFCPECGTPTS